MRQFISGAFVTTKHVRSVSQDLIPNKAQVGEVTVNFNLWQIRPAIVFDSHFAANNIIIGFRLLFVCSSTRNFSLFCDPIASKALS